MRRSGSAFDETILPTRSGANWCSCPSAAAWNVRAVTPGAPSASSRARSSPAALSVNVTARISSARNAPVATWFAIRCVIVVVLPEPGAGEDADGPAHRLDGAPLLGVQLHRAADGSDGTSELPDRSRTRDVRARRTDPGTGHVDATRRRAT